MRTTIRLLLLIFFATPVYLFAQPANDDCAGAISITPQPYGSSCSSPIAATTANATPSANAPSCAGVQADDDIWYLFTAASASVMVRVSNAVLIPSGNAGCSFALYESACPAGSGSFFCTSSFAFGSGFTIVNGLTIGNTYYLRFWNTSTTADMNFNFCVQNVPPPPANDECTGAISLTVNPYGTTCTSPAAVSTEGATQSAFSPTTCTGTHNNDDVWYSFTATSPSAIIRVSNAITTTNGNTESVGFALYNGSCPATTAVFTCETSFAFGNGLKIIPGLTIGNTYYLRVWMAGVNNYGTFNLCIQATPPPPANDECTGAIGLTVNPYGTTCTSPVVVNTEGATQSAFNPTACTGTHNNDDVWYSFTATSASAIIRISNALNTTNGSSESVGYALYEGSCPATTTAFACDAGFAFGNGYRIVPGLTVGNTYYLRMWLAGVNNYGTFNLCVQATPPPPLNDECTGAIGLTVNPYGSNCTSMVAVNTEGATQSAFNPTTCTSTHNNDDVWYSFTATSQSAIIRISNAITTTNGSAESVGFSLYEGSCPASTAVFTCELAFAFSGGYKIVPGLTIGQTYYLRMWMAVSNNYGSFNLCVQATPPPPVNDECSGAIGLTVNPFGTSCSSAVAVTTEGATQSAFNPTTCTSTHNNDDVWYSFTATSQSAIIRVGNVFATTTGDAESLGLALYEGSCPATTAVFTCELAFVFSSGYKIVTGLTIGNTYYLRMWLASPNNYGTFTLCVQATPPPPANDECSGAILITTTPPTVNCTASVTAATGGATQTLPNPSCAISGHNSDDIWYRFVATTPTHKLNITGAQLTASTGIATIGYAFYSNCPSTTTTLLCNNQAIIGNGTADLTGLTVGNTYYLRLWSAGINNYCSFHFCIQETPANNECTGAVNLPIGNGFCTTPIIGSLVTATTSAGFGAPVCNPAASGNDVWYKLTVPATGNAIVQTSAVNTTVNNLLLEAYSGSCGSLTFIACDDDGNLEPTPSANHARLTLTGRTPGEQVFFRVMPATSGNRGDFVICAWDTTVTVLPAISEGGSCVPAVYPVINTASLNRYMWVPVFDSLGRIVAEIYSNGVSLDTVKTSLFTNTGAVRQDNNEFILDRNMTINPTATSGTLSAIIRWYIPGSELSALRAADSTVSGPGNLQILKSADVCQAAYPNTPSVLTATAGVYGQNHYLQFSTTGFSSFYAEGKCGPVITWTGSADTQWHNPANWGCGGVPWKNSTVVVPSGSPRYPVVMGSTEVKSLTIQPGATVTVVTGVELKVNGQ